jgi:hypothetical protein
MVAAVSEHEMAGSESLDAVRPVSPRAREERRAYDTIVVVGGGCYGSYYVTQLHRARVANAVTYERVIVVDKDPACKVALADPIPDVEVVLSEWTPFFDQYLSTARSDTGDAIVPSPLMPHLMYEWLLHRARNRWPARAVMTQPLPGPMNLPWETQAPDGTQYGSFATWMCPINCVEPRRCPHTRGPRTWTMPAAAAEYVAAGPVVPGGVKPLDGPVIFHCTHRAYGVGMFDTREVLAGDAFVATAGSRGEADVLVGTVSHCHGAFNVLHIGA